MKRILCLLLSFMLLLGSFAFSEQASAYVGVWIETDGFGTLTIRADGTAHMEYYDGTVTDTTWGITEDGYRFGEGIWYNSPMELLDENTLSVSDGWCVFTREGFLPTTDEALLLGAEPVGEDGFPFLGTWELTKLVTEGEEIDPSLFGMTMTITFYDTGLVTSDDGLEPYTTTWFVSYGNAVVEGDILVLDENDQLILNTSDGAMVFTRLLTAETDPANPAQAIPVGEAGAPFLGLWTLVSVQTDDIVFDPALLGMTMTLTLTEDGHAIITDDLDTQTTTWYVADGAAVVEGSPLTLNGDGQLVMPDEDGTSMIFAQDDTVPASEASDADELLALLELLAMMESMEDGLAGLPEHHQNFVGEWQLCYVITGGLTGDLRPMGITGSLSLYSDYTGLLSGLADEEAVWYEDEEGIIRFGENGMPMYLLGDEDDEMGYFLQYGSEASGCMIFHQDPEAVWTQGLYPLQPLAASAESSAPAAGGKIAVGVKYVCTSYSVGGITNDAAVLGAEYAVLFHENSLADFTMAGFTMTDLGCTVAEDGTRTIHYVGNEFSCVPTATGIDMDYFGIIYHMVPAE